MSRRFANMEVTRAGIRIGCAYVPPPPSPSKDAQRLQAALLEPRTARPLPLLRRVAGVAWRFL